LQSVRFAGKVYQSIQKQGRLTHDLHILARSPSSAVKSWSPRLSSLAIARLGRNRVGHRRCEQINRHQFLSRESRFNRDRVLEAGMIAEKSIRRQCDALQKPASFVAGKSEANLLQEG